MRPVLFALALISGCSHVAAPATPVPGPALGAGPVVTLERTVCYGTCPAYTVSAFADGRVVFEGREHVARVGTAERRVDSAVVAALVARAEAAGHGGFAETLADPDVLCATDNPSVTTTVQTAAGTTRVVHDLGCRGFEGEAALRAFEDEVDRALGTAEWVGPR